MPAIELQRAYQILGVPSSASAHSIKQAYRTLLKRWHPDLYQSGVAAHGEATQMTSLIIEAYSAIKHAPLRYHVAVDLPNQRSPMPTASTVGHESPNKTPGAFPKTDRLEFWVRFACGALFGTVASIRLVLDYFDRPAILALGIAAVILGFGFAAARYGDKFWYSILRHWWLWS